MKWRLCEFNSEDRIKPQALHPFAVKQRLLHIEESHGVRPESIKLVDELHLDLGGMVYVGEPFVTVSLGPDRKLTVFKHQISSVISKLKLSKTVTLGSRSFRATVFWPGTTFFLSQRDVRRICAELARREDVDNEVQHRADMLARLDSANKLPPGTMAKMLDARPEVQA